MATAEARPGTIALVTGANRGLGKEICRQLARQGITVLATARDAERGREAVLDLAADGDVRFLRLDVTDDQSVTDLGRTVLREHGRLDILINNAGVTGIPIWESRDLEKVGLAEFRSTVDTNFVGAFAVTQALLPALRAAKGRVVNVTSALGTFSRATGDTPPGNAALVPYRASKAALNMVTVLLSSLLSAEGVTVVAASPGYVATDMNNHAGPKSVPEGANTIVHFATVDAAELPDRVLFTADGPVPW
jgi:NAD(P)-dependent dehydrogenase (short-subunit alcohol dehydrogenase family)